MMRCAWHGPPCEKSGHKVKMADAPVRPRHTYAFKTFQELVGDPVALEELEAIKQAVRAENPAAGTRVAGYPHGFAPARSFRFESFFPYDPHDTTIRYFIVDSDTGDIRISARREFDLFISPELEARILAFLRTHARTSNAFNIRRHALAAFGRAPATGPVSRRARKTRKNRRHSRRH